MLKRIGISLLVAIVGALCLDAGGHLVAPGEFAVEWLSPATGMTVRGQDLPGGRRHALGAPFDGPAVLYLRLKDQK